MSSGAKAVRSCLGWPFWPPILRFRFSRDVWLFFGLTMSLDSLVQRAAMVGPDYGEARRRDKPVFRGRPQ